MKKALWNLVNGLLAGIMIAGGGTVFLACFGDGSVMNKTIGAFFDFSFTLFDGFIIVTYALNLLREALYISFAGFEHFLIHIRVLSVTDSLEEY